MASLVVFAVLLVAGVLALCYMIAIRLKTVRAMSEADINRELNSLPLFFDFLEENLHEPITAYIQEFFKPGILFISEKLLRRLRVWILKIERLLSNIAEYLRGRRIAISGDTNGFEIGKDGRQQEFWNEMHEAKKNGTLKTEENRKEKKPE